MLSYFLTVIQQIFAMFLMVLVGYILGKKNMISEQGTKDMSPLLLKIVTPMVVISAYQRPFDGELMSTWCIAFAAATMAYVVYIILAELCYRDKANKNIGECKLGVVLPNCGFLAFPLLEALAGEMGIFFGSTSVILLNIIQWTYGAKLLCSEQKIKPLSFLVTPGTIAVVCSLILFCSPWKLPAPVYTAVSSIGSLNTPLAMIVLGTMLSRTNLKECLTKLSYYKIAALRLIAAPLIIMLIFKFIPIPEEVALVTFVGSVVPTATALSMLSQLFDKDYRFSANVVVLTTVLSVATMPILLTIGKIFLGY